MTKAIQRAKKFKKDEKLWYNKNGNEDFGWFKKEYNSHATIKDFYPFPIKKGERIVELTSIRGLTGKEIVPASKIYRRKIK